MLKCTDSHCHLDVEEFSDDREEVIARALESGVARMLLPAIDLPSSKRVIALSESHQGVLYPMIGLHPEEVRADWREQLDAIKQLLQPQVIAIGEVGLDFYWSREYEHEQLEAFEQQVQWSIETRLPLMIHCRKAQNELVKLLRRYEHDLPGGVFHCFTGNEREAAVFLQFERFLLGVGGVLTFRKNPLPQVLPSVVPLDRIIIETDSPYMAPVPMRGKRNEPSFVRFVLQRMAEAYGVSEEEMATRCEENVDRVFAFQ